MGWNSGALGGEIVCEVEKTVRFYRTAACSTACLTANLPADTVMNLEKGRLKFLYPQHLPPMLLNEFQKQQKTIQSQAIRIDELEKQAERFSLLQHELSELKRLIGTAGYR